MVLACAPTMETVYRSSTVLPLVLLLLSSIRGAFGDQFQWPLSLKQALSSTFAESRSTAFHMGIDLKTWGKTGFEVRAPAGGYVERLRTSPWGYGRALYLKLKDGRTLVFAHLSEFEPRSARRVEQAQEESNRYSVDLWLVPEEIIVKKGDLIARTGASGVGPPHLHLEMRDKNNVALNPLEHGFNVPDTTTPTITALALIPIDAESSVNGIHQALSVVVRWNQATGLFESSNIPSLYGRIGVGVLEYDRMASTTNKMASFRTKLTVDGRNRFEAKLSRISYADRHQIFLDRTILPIGNEKRNFANLFVRIGNRLTFYEKTVGGGLLHCAVASNPLKKGEHSLLATVTDLAGNASKARLRFRVNAPPEILAATIVGGSGDRRLEVELGDADDVELMLSLYHSVNGKIWSQIFKGGVPLGFFSLMLAERTGVFRLLVSDGAKSEAMATAATPTSVQTPPVVLELSSSAFEGGVDLTIRTSKILAECPVVNVEANDRIFEATTKQEDLQTYRVLVPLKSTTTTTATVRVSGLTRDGRNVSAIATFNSQALEPSEDKVLQFAGGTLTVPAGATYEPFIPQILPFDPDVQVDLVETGIAYQLEPQGISFDRTVNLEFRFPPSGFDPGKLGIYGEVADGRWALVGNHLDERRGTITCETSRFSRFALLSDQTTPEILEVYPSNGATISVRRPHLKVRFAEEGSGIAAEEDAEIKLDGRKVIGELDPDASALGYLVKEDLAPGKHQMKVRIADASGNESIVETEFIVE